MDVASVDAVRAWREQRPANRNEHRSQSRSEFQRDCDRILYSSYFRRLGEITQVASSFPADLGHNRLTHSLKVAQVGRRLAERILTAVAKDYPERSQELLALLGGLDPDVVEAAGLAHDLGHPPYGHHGEATLNRLAGPAGFNGNAQTLRVLTSLSIRDVDTGGLNLTRATLNAVLKYPWFHGSEGWTAEHWGVYESERELFEEVRNGVPEAVHPAIRTARGRVPSLEAAIMDWADDVTYAVHDVEDFYRAGFIPLHVLSDPGGQSQDMWSWVVASAFERKSSPLWAFGETEAEARQTATEAALRLTKELRSTLFGGLDRRPYEGTSRQRATLKLFASRQISSYLQSAEVSRLPDDWELRPYGTVSPLKVTDHDRQEVELLKELVWYFVIARPGLASLQVGQAAMLHSLHRYYTSCLAPVPLGEAQDRGPSPDKRLVPVQVREQVSAGVEPTLAVRDKLAGLTEAQVERIHRRLHGIDLGNVADPVVQ